MSHQPPSNGEVEAIRLLEAYGMAEVLVVEEDSSPDRDNPWWRITGLERDVERVHLEVTGALGKRHWITVFEVVAVRELGHP